MQEKEAEISEIKEKWRKAEQSHQNEIQSLQSDAQQTISRLKSDQETEERKLRKEIRELQNNVQEL